MPGTAQAFSRSGKAREAAIRERLLPWFHDHFASRKLPWRRSRDPYRVWVSETMLQQTRAQTVIPYWERFVSELPTIQALAEAPLGRVLSLWSGLGYYRRARMLHAAAKRVAREYGGDLPEAPEDLRRLEGVGAYTAGAIASIAFGRRAAAVDGNVVRVLARLYALREDVSSTKARARIGAIAERLVPPPGEGDPGLWNQALMELGATVCTPRSPDCPSCPVRELCRAHARGVVGGIPRISKKVPAREAKRATLVLHSDAGALLARRREGVLFGGLWEPPSTDGAIEALTARLGIAPSFLERVGEVVHVLSHRRLVVEVSRARVARRRPSSTPGVPGDEYEAVEWVRIGPRGAPADGRAHSSLTRKILVLAPG